MNPVNLLNRYICARYPVIAILSHEESRVLTEINKLAKQKIHSARVIKWTITDGLVEETKEGTKKYDNTSEPAEALSQILENKFALISTDSGSKAKTAQPSIFYVICDLHHMLNDAMIVRQLRDIANKFQNNTDNLILISPSMQIPTDLEKTVAVIDYPLPDMEELSTILKKCETDLPDKVKINLDGDARDLVTRSLQGLSSFEASSTLLSAVVATGELGASAVPHIVAEKAQIIKKSGVLEFFDTSVTMQNVGGLKILKDYANIQRLSFSENARNEGIDTPKGVLFVGVPGVGKSLFAKAVAGGELPLLRMDVGALMGGLVGQSEANMRSALKVAEAVSPCVLWVDEIEKSLGTNDLDGGTSSRVFGTLLTWMQETKASVYVVATANDAKMLKPELLRRFDDIFWVDLPNASSRREIFEIHLTKRNKPVSLITDELINATWGFSGAEIEKVVKASVKAAYFAGKKLTTDCLIENAKEIVPIQKTMGEKINELRRWAKERARFAAEPLEEQVIQTTSSTRKVRIEE
ncbi:MAG TPA: hypothetical protein DIW23_04785 [Anaerolineae bacterium]|nr:hypothetical protein [Anaerolineae bacterium]